MDVLSRQVGCVGLMLRRVGRVLHLGVINAKTVTEVMRVCKIV